MAHDRTHHLENMDDYQLYYDAVDDSQAYPNNLPTSLARSHLKSAIRTQLEARSPNLFGSASNATIKLQDVIKIDAGRWRIQKKSVTSIEQLHEHILPFHVRSPQTSTSEPQASPVRQQDLTIEPQLGDHDANPTSPQDVDSYEAEPHTIAMVLDREPMSRYIHISAPNARRALLATQEMFLLLVSSYQVHPRFLEFIFPFGKQEGRRDPHSGGFYSNSTFTDGHLQPGTLRPGRSANRLEYCYTLQAPEPARPGGQKWSLRQISIWHEVDLQSHKQVWIMIKANEVVWDELQQRTAQYHAARQPDDRDTLLTAIQTSLEDHLDVFNWSFDYWQEYVTSLETAAKHKQKPMLLHTFSTIDNRRTLSMNQGSSSDTTEEQQNKKERYAILLALVAWFRRLEGFWPKTSVESGPDDIEMGITGTKGNPLPDFSLDDLREVSENEEAANTARMNLQANAAAGRGLSMEYEKLLQQRPVEMSEQVVKQIKAFRGKMAEMLLMLELLLGRIDAYAHVLKERRSLMEIALQSRISLESQEAANRMEQMTDHMHREAVRMRLITVVTVLFLPATFASTFLSTSIFTWPGGKDEPPPESSVRDTIVGLGALQIFLIISVPVMIVMFISWKVMERRIRQAHALARDRLAKQKALIAHAK